VKLWNAVVLGTLVWAVGGAVVLGLEAESSAAPAAQLVHHDVIDLGRTYQTLDHFGASDAWTMQRIGAWSEANRKKMETLLFSPTEGIGLTCWRFNLGGGMVNDRRVINPARSVGTFEVGEGKYDWTRQANERQVLADAKAMGVPIFVAFVNSPPRRMTLNGLTNSFESSAATRAATQPGAPLSASNATTNLKPGYEGQYAKYLVDILEHFRTNPDASQRITFDWVSPVNEPTVDWDGGQEGSRYSNDDIKRVAKALHAELNDRNSPTKMLLVEAPTYAAMVRGTTKHKARYGDFVDVLLGDSEIVPMLGGVLAHHAYGADDPLKNLLSDREAFAAKMGAHKDTGVVAWMSEYCVLKPGRDLEMGYALTVARTMWADFAVAGNSAWDWWLAVSNGQYEDGLLYTNWRRAGDDESVIIPKMFWAFGNYSRFVRPGMVRVELAGDKHELQGVEGSAWVDKKTGRVVVVYVNTSAAAQVVQLTVKNGAVAGWTAYVTSDAVGDDLRKRDVVGGWSGCAIAGAVGGDVGWGVNGGIIGRH
jgi:O-Glycosyl hydrolase family 30